jgi:uncharacterized protein (TIGR02145 family)
MNKLFSALFLLVIAVNLSAQDQFTDKRDGNTYKTITIGGVTWMAENLRCKTTGDEAFSFDNNTSNIASYGLLYQWKTAMAACPDGWHLPSGQDFRNLMDQTEIRDNRQKHDSGPAIFKVQLAGMQDIEGTFTEMDESAYYWTSTEYGTDEAEYFSYMIINNKPIVDLSRKQDMPDIHGAEKTNKYSVRCIKN